ncbi:MAG: hypothetical protein J0H41_13235 [Rhizobiales bacterium]|nr:hypothetical protein [Hyphomicrobiales bacterium]
MQLCTEAGFLAFFSAVAVFGTPADIALTEIAIEASFRAHPATPEALRAMARRR